MSIRRRLHLLIFVFAWQDLKKENKELLTYLLFESHDTSAYINAVKEEMTLQFTDMNKSNVYFVKKTLRKILRTAKKYIRYSELAARGKANGHPGSR